MKEMEKAQQVELRDERGRMLAPLPGAKPITSSARAREMSNKRWESMRRKSNSRIVREAAAIDPTVKDPSDAFALLMSKQYVTLMDSDKPRIDHVERLGYIMAGKDKANSQRENGAPPPGVVSAQPAALLELVELIEQHNRRAEDQARASDGTLNEENQS